MSSPKYYGSKEFNKLLPLETAQRYKVVKLEKQNSEKLNTKYGIIDFKTLSVSRAAQLVKHGCPWIEEIKTKTKNESE